MDYIHSFNWDQFHFYHDKNVNHEVIIDRGVSAISLLSPQL